MATQNIEKLTNDQLRALLFNPNDHISFMEATAEYMEKVTEVQAKQMNDVSKTLSAENDIQDSLAALSKAQGDRVNQLYQQEADMQPSSMPSWLQDTLLVFTFLVTCLTLDPVLIGLAGFGMVMQMSGGQNALVKAACGDNKDAAAGFEFGMAMGEALLAGGASSALGGKIATDVAEEAAEQATSRLSRVFSSTTLKNTLAYSGQTLMQNNFWNDFLQGPCKMDEQSAFALGMFLGMGTAIGTSFAAEDTGLAQLFKNKLSTLLAKKGMDADSILRWGSLVLNVTQGGFQIGSSAVEIQIGQQYVRLADFHRDVMGPNTAKYSILQDVFGSMSPLISSTQEAMSKIADDATAENQTFSALGNMFRQAD